MENECIAKDVQNKRSVLFCLLPLQFVNSVLAKSDEFMWKKTCKDREVLSVMQKDPLKGGSKQLIMVTITKHLNY